MESIEQEIIDAKDFLFNNNSTKSACRKVWYGTTETIKDYMKVLNWKDTNRVLTVCSSGDHIFNLINQGIREIDSFDINPLTYPYFILRKAIMMTHSYKDFYIFLQKLSIASSNEKQEYQLFSSIKSSIDKPYDYFYEELYSENLKANVHDITNPGLLSKMCMNYIDYQTSKLRNKYYANEEEYEKTRNNLKNSSVTFKCTDIKNLPSVFHNKYDKIFLSNIADYFPINEKEKDIYKYIVTNLKPMLSKSGEILAAYIYNYIVDNEKQGIRFKCNPCTNSTLFEKDLEVLQVNNIDSWTNSKTSNKDAILIYRK